MGRCHSSDPMVDGSEAAPSLLRAATSIACIIASAAKPLTQVRVDSNWPASAASSDTLTHFAVSTSPLMAACAMCCSAGPWKSVSPSYRAATLPGWLPQPTPHGTAAAVVESTTVAPYAGAARAPPLAAAMRQAISSSAASGALARFIVSVTSVSSSAKRPPKSCTSWTRARWKPGCARSTVVAMSDAAQVIGTTRRPRTTCASRKPL
mmetsp:Transcript_28234/g.90832  ORF Transcript_28234/g.90832 Transcript_28234/m.90832 type:complete len:208 (+) Transcript_28234:258-881(+)